MTSLVVAGNTVHNILAVPPLCSLTTQGDLIVPVIAVAPLWLRYVQVRLVNKRLTRSFVLLNLFSLAVEAVSKMFLLLVMPIPTGTSLPQSFNTSQIDGVAGWQSVWSLMPAAPLPIALPVDF